jgi:hypothetical protein
MTLSGDLKQVPCDYEAEYFMMRMKRNFPALNEISHYQFVLFRVRMSLNP